jgi:ABC-type nitrate/sulfonate/bicarbonate transport system substrate-binding protein
MLFRGNLKSFCAPLLVSLLVGQLAHAAPPGRELPDYPPVYFYTGESALDAEGKERCEKVAKYLSENPNVKVVLQGGTDPLGSVAINRKLGRERAQSAQRAIGSHGVARGRIRVVPPQLSSEGSGDMRFLRFVKFFFTGDPGSSAVAVRPTPTPTPTPSVTPNPTAPSATAPRIGTVPKSSPGVEPPTPTPPKRERLNVVFWRAPNHMLLAVAKTKGYFAEEGLDINLVESQAEANTMAKDLELGWKVSTPGQLVETGTGLQKYFAGGICSYGFSDAVSHKRPLVQIGTLITVPDSYVMKKELADAVRKDLKAFKGKHIVVGVAANGLVFAGDPLLVRRLKAVGLTKGVDYKVTQLKVGSSYEAFQALVKGDYDAVHSLPPIDIAFLRRNTGFEKLNIASLYPYLPCCRQLVPRDNLAKNRAKYVKFERALIKAERLFIEKPSEAMRIIAGFLKVPVSVVKEIYSGSVTVASDPNLKGSRQFNTLFRGVNQDLGEFVDTSVYEEAVLGLAKDDPNSAFYKSIIRRFKRQN